MITLSIRTYSELIRIPTFIERYNYLKLDGEVGEETFGVDRYLNQRFYHSDAWRPIRDRVIARDLGCDLGIADREIHGRIIVHHMNPVCVDDILQFRDEILNEEFLICCSNDTHQAIHYGDVSKLKMYEPIIRTANDTCPWKG